MAPSGPYTLCTVNKVPARAKILIGRVVEDLKDKYTIDYRANVERLEDVKAMCEKEQPDILFCASMWTKEESDEAFTVARSVVPGIKTMAIPTGLQVEKGPDAVVDFLEEQIPGLLAQ